MSNSQLFQIKTLKCEKVVVFTDRAEVKRSLKVKLQKGENELVISNVSSLVDQDSVRYFEVNFNLMFQKEIFFRVEGKGEATVLDVIYEKKKGQSSEVASTDKVKKLQDEIKDLEDEAKVLSLKIQR